MDQSTDHPPNDSSLNAKPDCLKIVDTFRGVRGKNARTLAPGRKQVNFIATRKREHSRKPDELYDIIEACSPGPYLELFARGTRPKWSSLGNQADDNYRPNWPTYSHNSSSVMAAE